MKSTKDRLPSDGKRPRSTQVNNKISLSIVVELVVDYQWTVRNTPGEDGTSTDGSMDENVAPIILIPQIMVIYVTGHF